MRLFRPAALLLAGAACGEVVALPRSTAPLNASAEHPCDRYESTPVKAQSREGRCEVPGRPTFDFTIVVHVPETSHYAAGHTFVLPSTNVSKPLTLPALGAVTGAYQVKQSVSQAVGFELPDGQSIPVRATYVPLGRDARDTFNAALPLDLLFASSRILDLDPPTIAYVRSLPVGRWTRVFEPEPPYDAFFPPRIDEVTLTRGGSVFDLVDIGGANGGLDDPTGTSRDAVVTRAEGLDGWTVWLEDRASGRRVSTIKPLEGTESRPRLDTTGRGTSLEGLDAVVAPPAGWIGVPRLRNPLLGGSGLRSLAYPTLRSPIALEGLVAAGTPGGAFIAAASRVRFASVSVLLPNGDAQTLLEYATSVSTDDRGRFATVLPPGTYDITVEPLEGTGFASFRRQLVIDDGKPITLSPPRRTRVRGVAVLTDGRPAASAEILAVPAPLADAGSQPPPRPGRARTDETGAFALDLDQGQYVITAIPEEGTGFPRVVVRATIPFAATDAIDLGALRIPPPTRLVLQLRDPSNLARPINGARVRIFATPEPDPTSTTPSPAQDAALEIASGVTDSGGAVEILLAQRPK